MAPFFLKHKPSKAVAWQIDEACEKREEGKANADEGANRAGKAGGSRSWGGGGEPREGGKQQEGLEPGWGFLGVAAMRMSFGQKKRNPPA